METPLPRNLVDPPPVPDYALLRVIGGGAYGEVWLARSDTNMYRAVKVVRRAKFDDARPYEREWEGVVEYDRKAPREPSQLALLHIGRNDAGGFFYYVMELADDVVQGTEVDPPTYRPLTLRELCHGPPPPIDKVLELGVALAGALGTLHQAGLVHRDVKPSNVILAGGVPKFADIGLIAPSGGERTNVGTEYYLPAEGAGGPPADTFALGKVIYELATGQRVSEWPRWPAHLPKGRERKLFRALNHVLTRACDPEPKRRYRDGHALRSDLLQVQAEHDPENARRKLRLALRAAGVLGVVAAVALGGAWVQFKRAEKFEAARLALSRRHTYAGNLASAQRAIAHGDYVRARRLLRDLIPAAGEEDLRDWEWRVLYRQAEGGQRATLRAGGPIIRKLDVAPDQGLLAVYDETDEVELLRTSDFGRVARVPGVAKFAGFSADGRWLLGAAPDDRLARWPVQGGAAEQSPIREVWCGMLRGRGATVVGVVETKTIELRGWDFESVCARARVSLPAVAEVAEWKYFRGAADPVSGRIVVAGIRDGSSEAAFRLWVVSGTEDPVVSDYDLGRDRPSAVGFEGGLPWAVLDVSGRVLRADERGWRVTREVWPGGVRAMVRGDQTGTPGRVLGFDRVLAWQAEMTPGGGDLIGRGHGAKIVALTADARNGNVFSASADGALFAWSAAGPVPAARSLQVWDVNAGSAALVFGQDPRRFWSPGNGTDSVQLDAVTLRQTAVAPGMRLPVASTGRGLLGVTGTGGLMWADETTGALRSKVEWTTPACRAVGSSASGDQVAWLDVEGGLYGLIDGKAVHLASHLERCYLCRLDRAGRRLWLLGNDRRLRCLAWPTGESCWDVLLPATAPAMVATPEEDRLFVALENGTIEIRSPATGTLLRVIDGGSAAPQALALSPNGRRLFSCGLEGDIHCLATDDWAEVHVLPVGPEARLHAAAISPDGSTLAVLSKTGRLYVERADGR